MRSIKILLLLLVFAAAANAQDKKFLKWGDFQWELSYKIDTVDQVVITSNTGLPGDPTEKRKESRVEDIVIKFAEAGKHELDLGVFITDTIMGISPETLEEWVEVNKFSKLSYNIKGNRLSVAQLREFSKKSALITGFDSLKLRSYFDIDVYKPGVGRCGWYDPEHLNATSLSNILPGSFALVAFGYTDGNRSKTIGSILVEIN